MTLVKGAHKNYHINLTCGVIAEFLGLGHPVVEFSEDLCACLDIPFKPDFRKSIEEEISQSTTSSSLDELEKMCAEMGMIDRFYSMTPRQIELGYQAYCDRTMNMGNLIMAGIRKAFDEDAEPFDYYLPIDREETVKRLGLKEDSRWKNTNT